MSDSTVPPKLYSTGEVMEHTGLSRQTLHNYKRLGLIVPVKWSPSGHCYYDEAVFPRLKKIKLYQRHHPLNEIRGILDAEAGVEQANQYLRENPDLLRPPTSDSDSNGSGPPVGGDTELDLARKIGSPLKEAKANPVELEVPPPNDPTAPKAWSNNAAQAPELAANLLRADHQSRNLYRIGDVIRLTQYTRQTIHNYTIQGLLSTRERSETGHRLYGPEVFTELRLIEVFKRHRRFPEVQRLVEEWRQYGETRFGSGRVDLRPPNMEENQGG